MIDAIFSPADRIFPAPSSAFFPPPPEAWRSSANPRTTLKWLSTWWDTPITIRPNRARRYCSIAFLSIGCPRRRCFRPGTTRHNDTVFPRPFGEVHGVVRRLDQGFDPDAVLGVGRHADAHRYGRLFLPGHLDMLPDPLGHGKRPLRLDIVAETLRGDYPPFGDPPWGGDVRGELPLVGRPPRGG